MDIVLSVTGVRRLPLPKLFGSGFLPKKSGTDGMTASGITGVYPRKDSLSKAGPGTRDTGIMMDTSLSFQTTSGTDSKEENGCITVKRLEFTQAFQEANQFADHSISLRDGDSLHHSVLGNFQDAK